MTKAIQIGFHTEGIFLISIHQALQLGLKFFKNLVYNWYDWRKCKLGHDEYHWRKGQEAMSVALN
jgi:hypothetical protein